MKYGILIVLTAGALCAGCSNSSNVGPMSGQQIREAFSDAGWSSTSGASSFRRADGTLTAKGASGQAQEGVWRVDGDSYCQTIPAGGEEACFTLTMLEDGRIEVSNGSVLTKEP